MLFDFAVLAAKDRYKLITATVVPRPIAWVVTQDAAGVLNAAPFSFFNAVSSDPPILAVSVGGASAGDLNKDTLANIQATGQFTLCLVPEEALDAMNVTAIDLPPEMDELAEAGLETVASTRVAPPRIARSPVAFECETHQLVPLGSNTLVLGRILAMHVRDDCVLDAARHHVDTPRLGLVGRMHGGGWYLRIRDLLEVPRIPLAEWMARKQP
jgi:flavin reductase (DIM6/NTAB) family NADH-FMN oxidoreductase RutF